MLAGFGLCALLIFSAAPAPSSAPVAVSAASPLGNAIPVGAPAAVAAAGQTAIVALVVRVPAGAAVAIGTAGELRSPKGRIPAARVSIVPAEECAPYGPSPAVPTAAAAAPSTRRVYWLRARVPRGQAAGRYRAMVRVSATAPRRPTVLRAETPVEIEVLPFDLIGASRQFVWLGHAAWQQGDGLLGRLRDIGVLTAGVSLPAEQLWPVLDLCRAQGARGAVPYLAPAGVSGTPLSELEAARREKPLPPVLWLARADQLDDAARLGASGVPVGAMLSLSDPLPDAPVNTLIRRVDPAAIAEYLKAPIPAMKSPKPGEPPARRLVQWWSWDTAAATPAQNRLFAGFLLWRAGFTGACLEEEAMPTTDRAALARRWEAVRGGVDDVRYLTTYYNLLRQMRDKDRRHPLPDRAEASVAAALARLTPASSFAAAEATRQTLARWIAALKAQVG